MLSFLATVLPAEAPTSVVVATLAGDEMRVTVAAEQTLTVRQARRLARDILAAADWATAENQKTNDTLKDGDG